ncbi:dihydropteroate synthase [Amycolatopsis sacchari]|uniref:dihydropteroate synthase n=1 Tax=Amycolatopsis sacchari TaxID=115433 RepID=UPI003D7187D7
MTRLPDGLPAGPGDDGPVVMGILNVTPDSFSDGGRYLDRTAAVRQAELMMAGGAAFVDVGGESTRPGAARVDEDVEAGRVVPVIAELHRLGVPTTIDTMRSAVARAALDAGCLGVNDVSGGLADPRMASVVASAGCPWILTHWRGHSRRMREYARYSDVLAEVRAELRARVVSAVSAGVSPARIAVDPGLGFAKNAGHNWRLLANLDALAELGYPIVVGASRKSFLGELPAVRAEDTLEARDAATTAVHALAAANGASIIRTHDVRAARHAIAVAGAWGRAAAPGPTPRPAPDRREALRARPW